jgi:hypothetical protein
MSRLAWLGIAFIALGSAAQAGQRYVWNTYLPGESVAYGVPDTDDRSFRVDCAKAGGLEISGPSGVEGGRTSVVFKVNGQRITRRAHVYVGDVPQFVVSAGYDDPVIVGLLAGHDLSIRERGDEWRVPGAGAARVLKPLIAACMRKQGRAPQARPRPGAA